MTILQNDNSIQHGQYTGNNFGDLYSGTRVSRIDTLVREGIRRRKPVVLDEQPYSRVQLLMITPSGEGVRTLFPYPGSYSLSGLHDNFGQHQVDEASLTDFGFNANLRDNAYNKALNKLDRMDMDFGTAFAESGKVAKMVGDIATTSVKALNAVHKHDIGGLLQSLNLSKPRMRGKGIVDAYLTYQYGIKPLLQDVAGATSALTRLPQEAFRVGVKSGHRNMDQRDRVVGLGTGWPLFARSVLDEGCRVKVSAIPRPLSREEDIRWSLGLDNYGLTQAWELTPWSFVLDWAVPIGDYVRGLTTMKYYTGWQIVQSERLSQKIRFGPWSGQIAGGWNVDSDFKNGEHYYLRIKRTILSGPPMYGIPYKDPRSIDHMAKGLALLASTLASKGNPPRFLRV
jgi:hypothetical protein